MEWRIYKTERARKSALTQLLARGKFNYIVVYKDTRGPALHLATAHWVGAGNIHVDR